MIPFLVGMATGIVIMTIVCVVVIVLNMDK